MNNMQKAFKRKAGLKAAQGLADGGVRRPEPEVLGTGMARHAGEALKGRAARLAQLEAEAMGEAPPPQEPRRKGLRDGGQASPELLGWGMARSAGQALAGRGAQLAAAENEAMNGAPAPAPAAPVAPAGAGGLSRIRDNAVPPAEMLLAQRRGLADGGTPAPVVLPLPPGYKRFYETDGMARSRLGAAATQYMGEIGSIPASNTVDVKGRPVEPNRIPQYFRGHDPSREPMVQQIDMARQKAGYPSSREIRAEVDAKMAAAGQRPAPPVASPRDTRTAQLQQMLGMADGGMPEDPLTAAVTRANTPPHKTRFATGTPFGDAAYREIIRARSPDLRSMAQGVADQRAAAGLPSGAEIRAKLGLPAVRPDPRMLPSPGPMRMADGGAVRRPEPEMLGTGLARGAGEALRGRAARLAQMEAEAMGEAPAQPAPQRRRLGLRDGGARGNADQLEEGNGGAVRGPGGPTADAVGPVALSNDEYVLPADTVDAMGGPEALDQLRDATHEFVDEGNRPRGLADGGRRELEGPADPGWFARQHNMASTERRARAAVEAGTADADQQAMVDRNNKLLNDPAVMNPLGDLPGIGLASRTASAATDAAPGIVAGLRSAAGKATDFLAAKVGASTVAKPAASAVGSKLAGAMPTAPRMGANFLTTQTLGADDVAGAPRAVAAGAQPAPAATAAPGNAEDARVSQALAGMGVSSADQGSDRVTYAQAQGLSRARPQAGKNYRLGGGQYSDGNADIFAGSTRADGTLNNFSGVGNGNRPNWEQRNPQDHQAALDRAASDKERITSLAVSHIDEGTTDGLDRAYQLAAGDPEATAAVEAARQQYGLRRAAMRGNKEAGAILRQQDAGAASRDVANITAGANERVGLAKARADMEKARRDQFNSDRTHALAVRTADRADGKSRRGFLMQSLEGKLGKQFDKDGNLSPAFAGFEASLRNTLQRRTTPDGQPLTVDNLPEQQLEQLAQAYALNAKAQPGWFGDLWDSVTGNDLPETNDLGLTAPRAGTAKKRILGGYSYTDERGKQRRVDGDLTFEELQALGVLPVGGQ